MKTAAIAKLKATLSEYIDCVKSGEEVIITDRGKPVAKITSVDGELAGSARRMRLARRGIIRPGKGRISGEILAALPSLNISLKDISRVIEEEREDRI